ncbi:tail fiber domain-containing protein [Serratia marcescens]|uniref:tail fiber domain-containing protein n=1 Tax=Serratia marcescens TaxID=615 RepID=UPI00192C86A5|nr:tail fiber domain-containing protein [Serratia marcescens]MBL5821771.1 tail fiber domain-containing protein [Serratia marcescens]
MPAGTLTLTNNSSVVKGVGTAFNTELKAGDFIVSVVGGVTYTLPVKTVDSATQATLIKAYDGPTQAGAAWYAVPRDAMNTITAQLAAETAKALRGLNLDKNNWQQVFSGTGNITVTLPDGSTYTGPAWNSITASLNNKLDKTLTTSQEISGPLILKSNATLDAGGYCQFRKSVTFNDAIAAKKSITITGDANDASPSMHISQQHTKSSGTVAGGGAYCRLTAQGTEKIFMMSLRQELNITDYGFLSYRDFRGNWHEVRLQNNGDFNNLTGQWVNGSDIRMKSDLVEIQDPLSLIRGLKLYTGKRDGQPFIGGIAQEIEQQIPLTVSQCGSFKLRTGETIENIKAVDYATLGYVALAALNQAIERIDRQDELIKKLMEKLQ